MRSLSLLFAGLCTAALLAFAANGPAAAQEKGKKATPIKVGEKAPSFDSVDESGNSWKSKDHIGKKILVLYFYPADFTGGCTSQACAFRDDIEKLGSKGIEVVGVSGDSAETHKLFKSHHKLPFTLLADEKGTVAKAFGVPVNKGGNSPTINEKGEKGTAPRGVTIARWTVVIDREGNVAAIDSVTKAGDDAKRVAELVKKLDTK